MSCRNHDSVSYYFEALTWDLYRLTCTQLSVALICNDYEGTCGSNVVPRGPWGSVLSSKSAQEFREANV